MLNSRDNLLPGAAAVVGRFFRTLAEHGEHWTAPSQASFDAAAKSEPTLHTLLKTLEVHAPGVALGAGREARRAWYARRPKKGTPRRKGPSPLPEEAPREWPDSWRALYPGLRTAQIKPSSKRRYVASLNRLSEVLERTDALPEPGFYMAWCCYEELAGQGIKARTIGGYLDAVNALAKHGGLDKADRAGLVRVRTHVGRLGDLEGMEKVDRIRAFVENGAFEMIAQAIVDLHDLADTAPGWTSAAEHARQTAAVLAVVMNTPARTGDVAAWRLGHELIRHASGDWELAWTQEKTDNDADFGIMWPEVGAILDALILAGRPDRLVLRRYESLEGMNWLTLRDEGFASRWPSDQVTRTLGIPLHDVRTISADYLRWHDPQTAADTIQALLGHCTRKAGESYRAMTEGEAAAREWARMRKSIAKSEGRNLRA
jgi:hypothetical protein